MLLLICMSGLACSCSAADPSRVLLEFKEGFREDAVAVRLDAKLIFEANITTVEVAPIAPSQRSALRLWLDLARELHTIKIEVQRSNSGVNVGVLSDSLTFDAETARHVLVDVDLDGLEISTYSDIQINE